MVEFTANCCPECRSKRLYKDGLRHLTDGSSVQRFLCRECGRRFSYGNSNKASGASKKRQVCVTWQGAKNLDPATKIKTVAGESQSNQQDVKGRIISYAFYMEKQGYARETIRGYCSCLKALQVRNANLVDAESVKETLAREKTWSQNRRRNVINAYSLFLKVNGLNWEKPRCHVTRKIPFIPTEREIDLLVAGCSTKTATFLQLLKETGMRSGEAKRLSWTDIDFERRLITLNQPEKRSLPRQWSNLSTKLLNMLNFLPRTNLNVFGESTLNSLKATFCRSRRKLACKLQNPRLLQIHFHTLRHWKATMEYHKTKDLLHVMRFLGHKKSDSTLLYIQLEEKLFKETDDEFTVRTARNVKEAAELAEVGFQLFDIVDGVHLYRKRK